MARKFTKITPTTDNEVNKPKSRPTREKKEKPVKGEKKKGGLLNRNKETNSVKRSSRPTKEEIPNNKPQDKRKNRTKGELKVEQGVDVQNDNRVKEENSKPFSVPAYLGYETLDITVAEPELDMYTKLLLKTVRKKNSLGSISLIPLSKVCEGIEKLVAEFIYRGGGMDDDLLTEDDEKLPTLQETKSSRVKAL